MSACELQIRSESARRTEAIGRLLGALLAPGDVICLAGRLGAGKTAFCRGVGAGWGAAIPLSSPTYNLAHEHRRLDDDALLIHIDLYRIADSLEAESLALDDTLDGGAIVIIEWPQRVIDLLPPDHLWIDIEVGGDRRELVFEARGERYKALLTRLASKLAQAR